MSDPAGGAAEYAALFESITGETTVTDGLDAATDRRSFADVLDQFAPE